MADNNQISDWKDVPINDWQDVLLQGERLQPLGASDVAVARPPQRPTIGQALNTVNQSAQMVGQQNIPFASSGARMISALLQGGTRAARPIKEIQDLANETDRAGQPMGSNDPDYKKRTLRGITDMLLGGVGMVSASLAALPPKVNEAYGKAVDVPTDALLEGAKKLGLDYTKLAPEDQDRVKQLVGLGVQGVAGSLIAGGANAIKEGKIEEGNIAEHTGDGGGGTSTEASSGGGTPHSPLQEEIKAEPQATPRSDVQGGGSEVGKPIQPTVTEGGGETVGIRQESFGKRFGEKIVPGKGASTAEMVKQGQELYASGKANADAIGEKVRNGEGITAQEVGVLRAKSADLAKRSNDLQTQADKDPSLQGQADQAFNEEVEWNKNNVKPAETEWNKMGMAMQGETDIDTGTLVGLKRAVQAEHGRDLTPNEVEKAKELSATVSDLNKKIDTAQKKISEQIQKTPEQLKNKEIWTYAKANYIDKGADFETMLRGVSQDKGVTYDEVVKALTEPKSTRVLTREMLKNMSLRRQAIENAKSWVKGANTPRYQKAFTAVWRVPFSVATLGHVVGMVTHAGQHIFMPSTWREYFTGVKNQFTFWGNRATHELGMQQLEQHPNFYMWKKAGLAIDPRQVYDPYQAYSKWMGKLGEPGRRSMDALKVFRLADAEAIWDKTPESLKIGDYAKEIANLVNHQSGLGKIGSGNLANIADIGMFAARLEASRWGRILGDPAKATATYLNWDKATPAERASANLTLKRSAEFVGVYLASLAANEGLNVALGAKNRVNFNDPSKSDFLKFKMDGLAVDPTGSLTTPVRLLASVAAISLGAPPPRGERRFNAIADRISEYGRGKLSPMAGIIADVGSRSDFMGRPLPNASPEEKMKSKEKPYTWAQYLLEEHGPIATSGFLKEIMDVWKSQGMSESQASKNIRALGILGLESLGVRAQDAPKPKLKSFVE